MNFIFKAICFSLAFAMIISFVGCDKEGADSTVGSSSDITASNDSSSTPSSESSDNFSSNDSSFVNSGYDIGNLKPFDSESEQNPHGNGQGYLPETNNNQTGNHDSAQNTGTSSANSSSNGSSSSNSSSSSSSSSFEPEFDMSKSGYKFVWGDEFDGSTLDKNKWSDQNTKMTGANVLMVESTSKTINVKDGTLNLIAYKDNSGVYHVPSSVHTQGTMNYKYGYMEMRAKLSLEVGSFASFWTRSISDNPKAAIAPSMNLDHFFEVDMFEVFQKNGSQRIGGNILINSSIKSKNWYPTAMPYTQQHIISDEEFHVFGYEWTPTEIKLYLDNKMYARFDMSAPWKGSNTSGKGISGWNEYLRPDNTGTNLASFKEHQYLILNHHLHIEVVDEDGTKRGFLASKSVTENKDFKEAKYVIDYVRLYQKDGQELYTK